MFAADNVISGNGSNGVYIVNSGTTGNVIEADCIGTNLSGASLPNAANGVYIGDGASSNVIDTNVISANVQDGVLITGPGTEDNVLTGNGIGITPSYKSLGNGDDGVQIDDGASLNDIENNTIEYNASNGVEVASNSSDDVIEENQIDYNTGWGILDAGTGETIANNTFGGNGKGNVDS